MSASTSTRWRGTLLCPTPVTTFRASVPYGGGQAMAASGAPWTIAWAGTCCFGGALAAPGAQGFEHGSVG
jgi:hypothetical protein